MSSVLSAPSDHPARQEAIITAVRPGAGSHPGKPVIEAASLNGSQAYEPSSVAVICGLIGRAAGAGVAR
jgi:hypothetical protein